MSSPIEDRLHEDLRDRVAGLAGPGFRAEDVLRAGRAARRRRTAYAGSTAAAAVTAVAVLLGMGLGRWSAAPPHPATSTRAPASPSATATASGSREPALPPVWSLAGSADILRDGEEVATVPVPKGVRTVGADRVAGGWVVVTAASGPAGARVTSFLTDAGQLRAFAPPLGGARTAFAPGGRTMAAYQYPYLHVYDLPSLREQRRIDVRQAAHGDDLRGMWLRGDRLALSWASTGDAPARTLNGLAVHHLGTGAVTVSEGVVIGDISADGTTALLLDGPECLRVAPFADAVTAPQIQKCLGDEIRHVSLSPDGALMALFLNRPNRRPDVRPNPDYVSVFRTAQLHEQKMELLAQFIAPLRPVQWTGPVQLLTTKEGDQGPTVFCSMTAPPACEPVMMLSIPQTVFADHES